MPNSKIENVQKIAFFDVDETIINRKSMFDFLRFYLERKRGYLGKVQYQMYWSMCKVLAKLGVSRDKINSLYYRLYRGESYQQLMLKGHEWYVQRKQQKDFFIQPSVDRLIKLNNDGYDIVFISGSFRPCLEPLAQALNVNTILCAELIVNDDVISGQLSQQAIGNNKARLIHSLLTTTGVDPKDCYAFGDHISDLAMLKMVGHPIVVANCPELIDIAEQNHWEQIKYIKEPV
ncbi:HAD-IB family hydrolase [Moritella sp. 5]|uniref:HAD-IB family hydrolase n=1 Tax=Moritella sp. 5 TaxID=2746231 RepID=UPI001BABAA15|nr:HAD-IB family hydrolase [Moritella sp. 5]QUM82404.1 HAD-IB family hydrolase [Moritella sp. 5]